jgi:arylsulfatase A-like enzyme
MRKKITRRDFLKLAGLLPISIAAPNFGSSLNPFLQTGKPQNVIVVVFDALSAYHISLHGYQRETTPSLARLAERAVVYHNHYAGGNFTTPGTASLLTGTLPWTNRALEIQGTVDMKYVKKNMFTAFQNYYRIAYSHNRLANVLEKQFKDNIDDLIPRNKFLLNKDFVVPTLFEKDEDIFTVSWVRNINRRVDGVAYSLFLSYLNELGNIQIDKKLASLRSQYPRGIPGLDFDSHYLLEDAIDWFGKSLSAVAQPFISYLHFMPPHFPYKTHQDFFGRFEKDNWKPIPKSLDLFFREQDSEFENLLKKRIAYDEFILYVDREFGKFFTYLENSGLLDNTWVIMTSDHGEMFERGIRGHTTPVLYEPIIRIPLLIFEPGRKSRLDIHTPTSAIDVLPTLLHVTGHQTADWAEGMVLPPYTRVYPDNDRSIYVLEAKKNIQYAPLTIATTALIKGGYKLMYFFGYDELGNKERVELYDLGADPEEINDLYNLKKETASEMLNELKMKIEEVDKPFLTS